MVIFVMMLISTALMYYYFQRSRSLERDLYALQNGEPLPGNSSDGLFNFMSNRDAQPGNASEAISQSQPSAPRSAEADNVSDPTATTSGLNNTVPDQAVETASEGSLDLNSQEATYSDPDDSMSLDSQESVAQYPGEGETQSANNENAPDGDATHEGEQDRASSELADPEGQSLYNLEPPTVRVRAPQR